MLATAEQAIEHPTFWNELNLARAQAELAAAEQRWPDAFINYEAAVRILARKGIRLDWARALQDWAGGHVVRGEPADYERASALYREALALFEELGVEFYVNIIDKRLQALSS